MTIPGVIRALPSAHWAHCTSHVIKVVHSLTSMHMHYILHGQVAKTFDHQHSCERKSTTDSFSPCEAYNILLIRVRSVGRHFYLQSDVLGKQQNQMVFHGFPLGCTHTRADTQIV